MRPSRDEMLMDMALVAARRSSCSRGQVGVVIAREGRVLVTGYNGSPAGMEHCSHECDCGYPGEGGLLFEGKHLSNCLSLEPCRMAVHAEANAIAFAAKHGVRLEGGELFTTFSPCWPCSQLIVNAGIVRVIHMTEYRDVSGLQLLESAGIALE